MEIFSTQVHLNAAHNSRYHMWRTMADCCLRARKVKSSAVPKCRLNIVTANIDFLPSKMWNIIDRVAAAPFRLNRCNWSAPKYPEKFK